MLDKIGTGYFIGLFRNKMIERGAETIGLGVTDVLKETVFDLRKRIRK